MPAWTWLSSGVPCAVSGDLPFTAAAWPTFQACFASWDPPAPEGPVPATVGAWRIPSWRRVSVFAFHGDGPPSAPIPGWPLWPALQTLRTCTSDRSLSSRDLLSAPTASSLCSSLPFLHPNSRGPVAEGESLSTLGEAPQRPHPEVSVPPVCGGHAWGPGKGHPSAYGQSSSWGTGWEP